MKSTKVRYSREALKDYVQQLHDIGKTPVEIQERTGRPIEVVRWILGEIKGERNTTEKDTKQMELGE